MFTGILVGYSPTWIHPTYSNITSAEECQKKCEQYPKSECQYFTWYSEKNGEHGSSCWLKKQKIGETIKANKISGPKICLPFNSSNYANIKS